MIKSALFSILFSSSFFIYAESIPRDIWIVRSDEKQSDVKENLCLITGNVYEAFSESGVQGGIISNLNRSVSCKTDENGDFELTISAKDTAIFFYHESYVEIVCWNYDFKGGHHVVMDFVCSEKLPDGMIYMEEKPVIYGYSETSLSASLKLENTNDLTFTYPAYQEGWMVNLDKDEPGFNINGIQYPYIFWEGEKNKLSFKSSEGIINGFYIKTDTAISFFENSLTQLGLNQTEITDFITYWGPRVQQNSFATIQYLVDEDYDEAIGDLIIDPQPDNERRVYLLFEGDEVGKSVYQINNPSLTSFNRSGFTIVEWGGTEFSRTFDF